MNKDQKMKDIKYYPLTHPQKRIWYMEKIYTNTSMWNIGGPVRIKGSVNFKLLEESINIFIKINEGLRLRFIEKNGEVKQFVSDYIKYNIDFFDYSSENDSLNIFNQWVNKEAEKPYKIEDNDLFYFAIFKISDNDNGYFVKFHHIISDGWSMNIMTEQICDIYMKLLNGEGIDENLKISYIEYIELEKKYLLSNRFIKNKSFWNEKFSVLPELLLDNDLNSTRGKRKSYQLNTELSLKIKKIAIDRKISLNTFFVTLFLLYLNKTTQKKDIVIGTPVLNRSGKKEKSMFGMFTSTMPFRYIIKDTDTIDNTFTQVNRDLMACYFNQKYPYDILVNDLELKKKGYDNLFDICVNYYNTKLNSELNGAAIENIEVYNGNQMYALQLVIKEWSTTGSLTLDFDYKISVFTDEQIDDMFDKLNILIYQAIDSIDEKVNNISLLSPEEKEKLFNKFNKTQMDYPIHKTIYRLFEEQVERTPNKIAISYKEKHLTYSDLNQKANQLARFLIKKGVEQETIVGLFVNHSIETIISILAIIKSGGAYLPIEVDYPTDRINYMLEDANVRILLTNHQLPEELRFAGEVISLKDYKIYDYGGHNLEIENKPNSLVYVIYTSGSTGKPKGTMIEHQGLVNYICWAQKMYIKDENEIFPLYSSLAFDLTVTSIFTPLISGAQIIVYRNDQGEYVLYRIMKENKSTVVKLTPAHLSLLKDMDNTNSSVKRFIVGGEDLKTSLTKKVEKSFNGNIEIYNEYGPTETVVGCMIHKFDKEMDIRTSVPIGIPADNVQIYILDKWLNPVASNIIGELYISGDGVARGYLGRKELTKEKFIDNPFIKGTRMYKTGDTARFLIDGKIEYVGRTDHQIKIRGYRIELGEIQKHLLLHEAIKEAVVIVREDKNKYLCAYIVKKKDFSQYQLKQYLEEYLPDYMIPLFFVEIDAIPLTINGKVNTKLLPEIQRQDFVSKEKITYSNEYQKFLIKAICDVIKIENISINDNFYYLGGDSIKAIQIASKLSNKGLTIKVQDILSHPIIEEMALYIIQNENNNISQDLCVGSIKPTPIVSWFFSHKFRNPNYYNQSILLDIKQDIKINSLELIFNELIKHHDALRINYNPVTHELFYNNDLLTKKYTIRQYDLSIYSSHDQLHNIKRLGIELKSSFNIENNILIKGCIFNLGQNKKQLLLTAHHLVVDGVSWRIIIDDICILLENLTNNQNINLAKKTNSYQKWAKILNDSYTKIYEDQKKYWDAFDENNFVFPYDHDLGADTIDHCNTKEIYLDEEETKLLLQKSNESYNTEPKELLIISLALAIKNYIDINEIIIEVEGHGRESKYLDIDINRTIGWFTCIYPVKIEIISDDISFIIKSVKEQLRKIPDNGFGYGVTKYLSYKKDNDIIKDKNIRFNYLGDFDSSFSNDFFSFCNNNTGSEYYDKNHITCLLDINAIVINKKLRLWVTYSKNKYNDNTIEKLINDIKDNLRLLITHCCSHTLELTPSDFETIELSQNELDSLFK